METRKVYKLVRVGKDGQYYPLFIGKNEPFRFGEVMPCQYIPTKGFAPRSVDENQTGGWHCCFTTVAPHLAETLKDGEQRVWLECEGSGKTKTYRRGLHQGGDWILVENLKPIRVVPGSEVRKMQAEFNEKNNIPYVYRINHVTIPDTYIQITVNPDRKNMVVGFQLRGKLVLSAWVKVTTDLFHSMWPDDLMTDIRKSFKGYKEFNSVDGMYSWTRD